jgi:Protein of unknown function (DUF1570)
MDRMSRSTPSRPAHLFWVSWLLSIAGCATMGVKDGKPLVPTAFQIRTGPYVICTNDRLESDAPVVRQLQALEGQMQETLGLKVDTGENPVEIYILDDRRAFDHFLTFYYPELPHRRAFFLANGNQRVVYTFFGDRLEEDVRHEATHALLHIAIGDIPLWLDEGLAEYFESPTERKGINPEHLGRLPGDLAAGWAPDLFRLESLQSVRQMSPRDYRESWAWVHYLLNEGKPEKTALLAYLADLRTSPAARPISTRLELATTSPLLDHLARVRENPIALDAPKDPTVRLQSAPVEPVPTPKKRGFFGRIRDLFGP